MGGVERLWTTIPQRVETHPFGFDETINERSSEASTKVDRGSVLNDEKTCFLHDSHDSLGLCVAGGLALLLLVVLVGFGSLICGSAGDELVRQRCLMRLTRVRLNLGASG